MTKGLSELLLLPSGYIIFVVLVLFGINHIRPLQKGIFLPPALFANAHLLLNKLRFAA